MDVFQEPLLADVPKFVDWRDHGYVTPVKDQVGHVFSVSMSTSKSRKKCHSCLADCWGSMQIVKLFFHVNCCQISVLVF